MARWNDLPWREDVYEAAELWKNRCLLNDGSLTGDSNIWTLKNLTEVQNRIVNNADYGSSSFWKKLYGQLEGANPDIFHLGSEIMWLIYLFPLGRQAGDVPPTTKASTKLQKISEIRSWGRLPTPSGPAFTSNALSGIGRTGRFYRRYFHALRYVLQILTEFKKLSRDDQAMLLRLNNSWKFAEWNDQFKQETQVPLRHALMFFLFPDNFERMVSLSHKEEIVRDLSTELTPSQQKTFFETGGFGSLLAIDKAVFAIRGQLEKKYGTSELDYYRSPIDGSWGKPRFRP